MQLNSYRKVVYLFIVFGLVCEYACATDYDAVIEGGATVTCTASNASDKDIYVDDGQETSHADQGFTYSWSATSSGGYPAGTFSDANSRETQWTAPSGGVVSVRVIADSGEDKYPDIGEATWVVAVLSINIGAGVTEEDEETVGQYLGLNDDDDDENMEIDKDQSGAITGENDLIPVSLSLGPNMGTAGTVTLSKSTSGGSIKIWDDSIRTTEITLPRSWSPEDMPSLVYVEGTSASSSERDIELKLLYSGAKTIEDKVRLTVVDVEIDVDINLDGTTGNDTVDELRENRHPGVIFPVDRKSDGAGLDYLVELKPSRSPSVSNGSVVLSITDDFSDGVNDDAGIKIWTTESKSTEVTCPATYTVGNLPSSLWIDGVTKDTKPTIKIEYKDNSGSVMASDEVKAYITETISYAPHKGGTAYVWSSLPILGIDDGDEFEEQLEDQGFDIIWRTDPTSQDEVFSGCSLTNYKDLAAAGALHVISHGSPGYHYAVYADSGQSGLAACDGWRGSESGMTTVLNSTGSVYHHAVKVSSSWLSSNLKSDLDANKAITHWAICYSADGGSSSVKESAGGRWRIGYEDPTNVTEATNVNKRLFEYMNGETDDGKKRTAGEAWNNGIGYSSNTKMDGNDWTTLCPSPIKGANSNTKTVWPASSLDARTGWGCIIFDTYMDNSNSANSGLVKTTSVNSGTISNRAWGSIKVLSDKKYFLLSFDYEEPAQTAGQATNMKAVAGNCKNEDPTHDGRELDGDGEQPNEDDYSWGF